jgi:hypothetical protein
MRCRLALLTLLAAVSACDAPPRSAEPLAAKAPVQEPAKALSQQRVGELSQQCAKMSRDQFRRALKDGIEKSGDEKLTAQFTNHYNANLDTCFYLLTVASAGTLKKMLFDVNGGELYGEYLGPAIIESPAASRPKACRVESLYCASGGEWEVLVRPYMED